MKVSVETSYPRKKEPPKGFLDAVVGDTQRQVESKRVEEVVTAGSIDVDLQKAIEVCSFLVPSCITDGVFHQQEREKSDVPVLIPLHDRTFDLVLLSNWEDQIMYEHDDVDMDSERIVPETSLTTPVNKTLESGTWTKSIIWGPNVPFKDFTQLEFNHEDDIIPEERSGQ
jgi:transcription initiation factor TFIID subunit 1